MPGQTNDLLMNSATISGPLYRPLEQYGQKGWCLRCLGCYNFTTRCNDCIWACIWPVRTVIGEVRTHLRVFQFFDTHLPLSLHLLLYLGCHFSGLHNSRLTSLFTTRPYSWKEGHHGRRRVCLPCKEISGWFRSLRKHSYLFFSFQKLILSLPTTYVVKFTYFLFIY